MRKELIELTERFLKTLKETDFGAGANVPLDQHLLDDGWVRHTGDVCPVHELDEVRYASIISNNIHLSTYSYAARGIGWENITHYKVTKAYDPHTENKVLYAKDALVHKKPWTLWEFDNGDGLGWLPLSDGNPCWFTHSKYRRKQTKKPHGEEEKLDGGQKHLLRLIARDQQNAEGWCAVSAVIYPIVQKTMPADLVEHYQVEDGRGRARLTLAGENLIDAMAWL